MVVEKIKVTKFEQQNLKDSVWMWPQDWEMNHLLLRRCKQYIDLKVKLIYIYEPVEDALLLLLPEMMRFP